VVSTKLQFVPMRVVVKKGTKAAERYSRAIGLNPEAIAPGLKPTPANDLIFHGGKTIPMSLAKRDGTPAIFKISIVL